VKNTKGKAVKEQEQGITFFYQTRKAKEKYTMAGNIRLAVFMPV
jgi:hypothetical protein